MALIPIQEEIDGVVYSSLRAFSGGAARPEENPGTCSSCGKNLGRKYFGYRADGILVASCVPCFYSRVPVELRKFVSYVMK